MLAHLLGRRGLSLFTTLGRDVAVDPTSPLRATTWGSHHKVQYSVERGSRLVPGDSSACRKCRSTVWPESNPRSTWVPSARSQDCEECLCVTKRSAARSMCILLTVCACQHKFWHADMATDTVESPAATAGNAQSRRDAFLTVFKQLKQEMLAHEILQQPDAANWMERMLDYNVPGGKLNRGLSVQDTLLAVKSDASADDKLNADRLGWAIEFLQVRPQPPSRLRVLWVAQAIDACCPVTDQWSKGPALSPLVQTSGPPAPS
jgi:Polyprenyl synthetase